MDHGIDLKIVYEESVFPEDRDFILGCGASVITCKFGIDGPEFSEEINGPFVFRGSIQLGRRLSKEFPECISYLYDHVYDYSKYAIHINDLLLNDEYFYVEAANIHKMYERLGVDFFVKENNGYKYVGGGKYSDIKQDLDKCLPESLLMLAPLKEIGPEWRCVISGGKLLTYSSYGDIINPFPEEAQDVVDRCLSFLPEPAPMWTLDLCRHQGEIKVVEINSLLTAGWYDCNRQLIFQELQRHIDDFRRTNSEKTE